MSSRVCVLRLDALGDTLLSTPAIRLLMESGNEVTVFTHPAGTPVLEGLASTIQVAPGTPASELGRLIRACKPDVVVCMTEKRSALIAACLSRAPIRLGFDPGRSQPLRSLIARLAFTRRYPSSNDPGLSSTLHEVDRYCHLLGRLSERPPRLYFPPIESEPAQRWLTQQSLTSPVYALQLTPKWLQQGWSVQWLRMLSQRLPTPLVGLFGPAEEAWARAHFSDLELVLAPGGTLLEYGALLRLCEMLVTVDTGAAHVAAALGVPVVDVFPAQSADHCVPRWRPWMVEHRVVLKPLPSPRAEAELISLIVTACQDLKNVPSGALKTRI